MSVTDGVLWIKGNPAAPLAIVLRPEGGKHLLGELQRVRKAGIQTIVSLLEEDEADWLGLAEEGPLAASVGMRFLNYPIPDRNIPPDAAGFRALVAGLASSLRGGERIGVHCRGCIGRATVTAACTLIHLGWRPSEALAAIEKAREYPVPDTDEQLSWILAYRAEL